MGTRVRGFLLQLYGDVVLVPEHVEGTGDDAGGTAGAQTGEDDLVVEVAPLRLVRRRGHPAASIGSSNEPPERLVRTADGAGSGFLGSSRPARRIDRRRHTFDRKARSDRG